LKDQDNWSLSELLQAIVILAHFHSLSSFVFGCGMVSEIDLESGHTFRPPSLTESNQTSFDSATLNSNPNIKSCMTGDELMERMKQVLAEQGSAMEASQEELFQHFEKLESGECKLMHSLFHLNFNKYYIPHAVCMHS
jgi:sestrin